MRLSSLLQINIDRMLLLGPPGIGKTSIIKQIAISESEKRNKIFVDLNEKFSADEILKNPDKYYVYYRIIAPYFNSDIIEFPKIVDGYVKLFPVEVFEVLQKCEGILFVDEITNVQIPHIRTLFYSLLDSKELGSHIKLSHLKIVAAGNKIEHSEDAETLPKPLRNRLIIVNVEVDANDWLKWYTSSNSFNEHVAAFIHEHPGYLLYDVDPKYDDGYTNFASPRTWERVGLLLNETKDNIDTKIRRELLVGLLGPIVADKFDSFLKYNVDYHRLKNDYEYWNSLHRSQKLMAIFTIAANINKEWIKFLMWLIDHEPEMVKICLDKVNTKLDMDIVKDLTMLNVQLSKKISLLR